MDLADCRELIRHGSRTFFAASLLLPRRVRDPAYALYAFCRLADDAVDLDDARDDAVARLRRRLDLAYRGRPLAIPADRAFADMVRHFGIPRAVPEALIEGLEWDADGRCYDTLSELRAYAARVASTVGTMMTLIMGERRPEVLARACDLGVAMQLTNICRDVGEDARNGRIYLPRDWMVEAGLDPEEFLADPVYSPALGTVVARLLAAADALYDRALPGIVALPADCRPAIGTARTLYREIGREVERAGHDSVSRRAWVSGKRKLALLGRTALSIWFADRRCPSFCLDEVRFLVDAVAATPAPTIDPREAVPRWSLDDRVGYVIELFDRLERRSELARLGSRSVG